MQILTLYLTTSVVFLALDIVMLKRVLYPLFSSNLGDWLLEDPRMGPAAIFYLFYVGGVLFFASWPAFSKRMQVVISSSVVNFSPSSSADIK